MSPQLPVVVSLLLVSSAVFGSCSAQNNILFTKERLAAGESLTNGKYKFTMQSNCNLVLYDGESAVWSTRTAGPATGCYVTMRSDGRLVILDGSGNIRWDSKSQQPNGDFVCVLLPVGKVAIYGPQIWTTTTSTVGTPGAIISANSADTAAPEESNADPDITMVVNKY